MNFEDLGKTLDKKIKESRNTFKKARKDIGNEVDEFAQENPKTIGVLDGIKNAFLGTSCNRKPYSKKSVVGKIFSTKKERNYSKKYEQGVEVGKAVGYTTSGMLIATKKYVIGTLPILSRAAKKLYKKVSKETKGD